MRSEVETRQLEVRRAVTQQTIGGENCLKANPFTKNRKPKNFELSEELQLCLTALMEENEKNEKFFGRSYDQTWASYLFRDQDGKLRFHDLRHSCASILHANGVSLKTIQEILGHSQLSTTIMYTHLYEDQKAQALNYMSNRFLGGRPRRRKKLGF